MCSYTDPFRNSSVTFLSNRVDSATCRQMTQMTYLYDSNDMFVQVNLTIAFPNNSEQPIAVAVFSLVH